MIVDTIVIATLPTGTTVIAVAAVILALVLGVGAFLLFRSGGKKGSQGPAGAASDWQRQAQQGGWNQQQPGGWGQQAPMQQQAGNWGASPQGQQQPGGWGQQMPGQQPGGWGQQAPVQQPGGWGQQAPVQQPAGGWGAPAGGNPAQQPPANPWAAPGGAMQQPAGAWGSQGAQTSWDAAPAAAPQEPWAQQAGPPWGAQGVSPAPPAQQSPTGYSGTSAPGWGGQTAYAGGQGADPWGAPAAPAAGSGAGATAMPSWQQPGGYSQGTPGAGYGPADSDKTMLRPSPAGPQGAAAPGVLGVVRVEEGKEPGRIYEVRKDALSIGRSRESDIFLEDLAVSRLHASILNMGNGNFALKDEGSANGTKVNGQLVNKYQNYPLQEGDRIQLGQTVLVFGKR